MFGPIVVGCAPPVDAMVRVAEKAGWRLDDLERDPVQPVYRLRLV